MTVLSIWPALVAPPETGINAESVTFFEKNAAELTQLLGSLGEINKLLKD